MKDPKLYLVHIFECIEKIERYIADGQEAFQADIKTQDAVVRNFEIIGEAAKRFLMTYGPRRLIFLGAGLLGFGTS